MTLWIWLPSNLMAVRRQKNVLRSRQEIYCKWDWHSATDLHSKHLTAKENSETFNESVAAELSWRRITVQGLCPGDKGKGLFLKSVDKSLESIQTDLFFLLIIYYKCHKRVRQALTLRREGETYGRLSMCKPIWAVRLSLWDCSQGCRSFQNGTK